MGPFDAVPIYRARIRPDGELEPVYRQVDVEQLWTRILHDRAQAVVDDRLAAMIDGARRWRGQRKRRRT